MVNQIRYAALAAILALPIGIGAVAMAASAQASPHVAVSSAVAAPAAEKADGETPDDRADKANVDKDNVQEGPGETAEGGAEIPDANEASDKADTPDAADARGSQ